MMHPRFVVVECLEGPVFHYLFGGTGVILLFTSLGLGTEVELVSASSFAVDD